MDVIILAGGTGSRLNVNIPKPLLPLGDRTLLQYQVDWLGNFNNINKIQLTISREMWDEHKHDLPTPSGKVRIGFTVEKKKLGTGGAILAALRECQFPVYVMNVDDLLFDKPGEKYEPSQLKSYLTGDYGCLGVLLTNHPPLPFSIIHRNGTKVVSFERAPTLHNVEISVGHYLFDQGVDAFLPKVGDIEDDVLPRLAKLNTLRACRFNGMWLTVNDNKQYKNLLRYLEDKGKI